VSWLTPDDGPHYLRSPIRVAELGLADDFYFLTHDHRTGAPRLHQRAIGFGLAGCVITELLLSGWACVEYGGLLHDTRLLTAVDRRPAAPADLAKLIRGTTDAIPALWQQVVREPCRHSLHTWLDFVEPGAEKQVIARLVTAGHLGTHGRSRYPPLDSVTAGAPGARLWAALTQQRQLDPRDVVLLAFAAAAGLREQLLDGLEPIAGDYLDWLRADLPNHRYDIAELVTQTAAAVASSVLTRGSN
jgi:hypothetical protein